MNSGAPLPASVLLALTAVVLAAHLWALRSPPARVRAPSPSRPDAFVTRRIETAAAGPLAAAPAATRLDPAPRSPAPRLQVAASGRRASAPGPNRAITPFRIAPPARLLYDVTAQVKGQPVQGRSELVWRHDGGTYEADFAVDLPGLPSRRQHSAGRLGSAAGVEPLRYSEQRRGEQATHFEREAGRVSFSNNRPAAPLLPGAQDRLSVLLQLGALLAGAPARYGPGASIAIQTATTREAQPWAFTVCGEERLPLPGGEVTALKLARPARGEYDQLIEVWLAPGHAYAPVRLRLTQPNGDWVDHQWSATDRR